VANVKSRPISSGIVRKGPAVGPDYAEANYSNPWNVGIDTQFEMESESKTLRSPTATPVAMRSISKNGDESYDSNWEHGYRGGIEGRKKGRA
jgi:hypothetical protein